MKTVLVNRRQVLRGAGGVTLGLPFLPSLMPGTAFGVEYALVVRPCFVAMTTVHGGIRPENMYPEASVLTSSTPVLPGYDVKHGTLQGQPDGTGLKLSNVVRAASLTPKLVSKMNILRGFDYPYYIGHHSGGHLGNYVRSDQGPKNMAAFPTIDQVMAWSPSFYTDVTGVKMRSMVTGNGGFGGAPSFAWSNPQAGTGTINNLSPESNPGGMFTKLFGGGAPMPTTPSAPARPTILTRVLDNYKSLKQSNRRLSAGDKQRLDDHIAQLAELERTTKVSGPSAANCSNTKAPGSGWQGMNDVIAFAFACGVSRIATISLPAGTFANYGGNWHQDVAHNWSAADKQVLLTNCAKASFENVFADLIKKLDAIEITPGTTALDASLVQWTHEAGWSTHDAQDMPIIMAGSAAGYFKTGMFVDYRSTKRMRMFGALQQQQLGLMHRQWLATALQAMGVKRTEFEKNGKTGYGDPLMSGDYVAAVPAQIYNSASDPVPVITAT